MSTEQRAAPRESYDAFAAATVYDGNGICPSAPFAYASSSLHIRRAIQELHQFTADEIGIDSAARAEMERLLKNLQQLLVGISIMQVSIWLPKQLSPQTHER